MPGPRSFDLRILLTLAATGALLACRERPAPSPPKSETPKPEPQSPSSAADNFPRGQSTPESVACDLARSYIHSDGELLRTVSFAITPGSPERDAYNNFLDDTITQMDLDKASPKPHADWPASIAKVYKARPLSSPAPAAFGAENFRFTALEFVDVQALARDGSSQTLRTLVAQDEGSKLWLAIPRPDLFPQLSAGLNEESASTDPWMPPPP